jgi:hypothetical protein
LADALERYQDDSERRRVWQDLIREAAEAYLTGAAWPDWHDTGSGLPRRVDKEPSP